MAETVLSPADVCHCFAVRQAARWISQLYDQHLADVGLRSTQYAILAQLERDGPVSIAQLAEAMVMDRTTMTRNINPLERDGMVAIVQEDADRRRKEVRLTAAGRARLAQARPLWRRAQAAFERHYGATEAAAMRAMLRAIPEGRPQGVPRQAAPPRQKPGR